MHGVSGVLEGKGRTGRQKGLLFPQTFSRHDSVVDACIVLGSVGRMRELEQRTVQPIKVIKVRLLKSTFLMRAAEPLEHLREEQGYKPMQGHWPTCHDADVLLRTWQLRLRQSSIQLH